MNATALTSPDESLARLDRLEALSQRLPGLAALILPPLLAVAASVGLLSLIHSLAGTPEIIATIAVPVTVTVIYSTTYCFALWRARYA